MERAVLLSILPVAMAILVTVPPARAAGQDAVAAGAIVGVVSDSDGRPVSFAHIQAGDGRAGALADSLGRFRVDGVIAGLTEVAVRRIGYEPLYFEIDMPPASTVQLALRLHHVPQMLGSMVIEGRTIDLRLRRSGYYSRERGGFGVFVSPERVSERPAALASNFLRDMRGVTLVSAGGATTERIPMGRTARGGLCPLEVWLDGAPVEPGPDQGIDRIVPAENILAIEVYPRGVSVPVEFQRTISDTPCGVVVIWTKS